MFDDQPASGTFMYAKQPFFGSSRGNTGRSCGALI